MKEEASRENRTDYFDYFNGIAHAKGYSDIYDYLEKKAAESITGLNDIIPKFDSQLIIDMLDYYVDVLYWGCYNGISSHKRKCAKRIINHLRYALAARLKAITC